MTSGPTTGGVSQSADVGGDKKSRLPTFLFANSTRRMLKYGLSFAVLGLSFWYVGQKLHEGAGQILALTFTIDYALLSLSVIVAFGCTILGGWEWSMLLRSLGVRIPVRQALRVHLLTLMPKYAPGLPWQMVGKAYLCREAGVPRAATLVSTIGEPIVIILSGISVLLVMLPATPLMSGIPAPPLLLGLLIPALAIPYSLAVPRVLQAFLKSRMARRAIGVNMAPSYGRLLFIFVLLALTWMLFGFSLFLLVAAIYPVSVSLVPSFAFALTASFIISLLAFFAPLGLGVREGTLTFLLSLWLPMPVAALAAVMSRLVMAIGELLAFLVALRLRSG